MFLLVTLPKSWDTFCTAISNSAPVAALRVANVEGSLLIEEEKRKNLDPSSHRSNGLVVHGRSNEKGKSNGRVGERTARDVWDKLCSSYENKSATNKVFLMKKLFNLCMKEEGTISTYINKFNIIFTQLTTQGLVYDEKTKCIFLLCSLPSSWDMFCTTISNSAPGTGLVYNDILENLFIEEICRKSLKDRKDGDAYVASDRQRGRTQSRAKSKDHGGSHSKSRGSIRNVECYHYHKKGHVKKDRRKW
ncbi:hypothetical protein L7F22_025248 [Adiantum nelumboides]|nr:hypothetical protein [Adiantum nelumboides]